MKKNSVIMCAYNAENTISEAIESVVNQSIKEFEFIIINDGSTDKTLDKIKYYGSKDRRIKIINQNNFGAGLSRNRGIKESSGEYIAFIDADDIWLKNKLEFQIQVMQENSEADIIVTDTIRYEDLQNVTYSTKPNCTHYPDFFEKMVQNNFFFSPATTLFKRKLFDLAMYTQDHAGEDYYPFLIFALHGAKLYKINAPLYAERSLPGSLQRSDRSRHIGAMARHNAIRSILEKNEIYANYLTNDKIKILKNGNDKFLRWSAYTARYYMSYFHSLKFIIFSYPSFYQKKFYTIELIKTLFFPLIKLKTITDKSQRY